MKEKENRDEKVVRVPCCLFHRNNKCKIIGERSCEKRPCLITCKK